YKVEQLKVFVALISKEIIIQKLIILFSLSSFLYKCPSKLQISESLYNLHSTISKAITQQFESRCTFNTILFKCNFSSLSCTILVIRSSIGYYFIWNWSSLSYAIVLHISIKSTIYKAYSNVYYTITYS
ncbi:uncharacterized protein DC041_0004999, partial [Schistosoma bovis]